MDLAFVDKLSNDNNGVKYLLVRQDIFVRTVGCKRRKSKRFQKAVCAFLTMNKKESTHKNLGRQGNRKC